MVSSLNQVTAQEFYPGGVYAIGDVAFCLGFAIGPALSGTLVKEFGFQQMLVGVALICFAYCPLLMMLKDPPTKTEQDKAEQEVRFAILEGNYEFPCALLSTSCTGRRRRCGIVTTRTDTERLADQFGEPCAKRGISQAFN